MNGNDIIDFHVKIANDKSIDFHVRTIHMFNDLI